MSHPTVLIDLQDPSAVGEARRRVAGLCARLGFTEEATGKVTLALHEATANVLLHARHGKLLLSPLEHEGIGGVQLVTLDNGPGMADVSRCMEDGYSTAGTPGKGLGAISRLADVLDIYSQPGAGTALLCQVWRQPLGSLPNHVGVVSLPLASEEVCGDGWTAQTEGPRARFTVVDGLGHGPGAAQAARLAERLCLENPGLPPVPLLERVHASLRSTRGAVMAVAEVDFQSGAIRFSGVGNISATVISGTARAFSMVSMNGSLGHEAHRIAEYSYVWPPPPAAKLVMHSDGLSSRWRMDSYPGLVMRHPALVAAVLYRDFARPRDDVTVLVAQMPGPSPSRRWGGA